MPWLQLILQCSAEQAPEISDRLSSAGAAAVTLQDASDQPLYEPALGTTPLWNDTRVVALFTSGTDMETVVEQLRRELAPNPLPPARVEALEDKDWNRAWMDEFKPMRFGRRLWIVPSWHSAPDSDGVNILLDPGLAFGTGTHSTTRLCLEWLDAADLTGRRVIDYGCGSGILAIAAALLGAREVAAVDNDPQALQATLVNAERNGVADRIKIYAPEALPTVPAEVLLANILARPLVELSSRLSSLVSPGGHLVLSGILSAQVEEVQQAYRNAFELAPVVEHEGWGRLEGRRK